MLRQKTENINNTPPCFLAINKFNLSNSRTQKTEGRYHNNPFWYENCYIYISRKDNENMMTYNRRFSCYPFQRRHFGLRRSKGRCHGNQIVAHMGKKSHKNGHNFSCMLYINAQFGFEIGFQLSVNSSWHSCTQGIERCYHGNQFWD